MGKQREKRSGHLPTATRDSQNLTVGQFPSVSAAPSLPGVWAVPTTMWPLTSSLQETFYNGKHFKNTTATGQTVPAGLGPGADEQPLHGPGVFIETRRADLLCM